MDLGDILTIITTLVTGAAIFMRVGRFIERQEQHTTQLADHEARLRKVEWL